MLAIPCRQLSLANQLCWADQGTQNYTWTLDEINSRLHSILLDAFHRTLDRSVRQDIDMRTAASIEGIQRVAEAKLARGQFP